MSQEGPLLILGSRGHGQLGKFEFVAEGGGGGGWCHFKVGSRSRVNDIYVNTFSALVYSLHHDQTILKRTLSVKDPTYKE